MVDKVLVEKLWRTNLQKPFSKNLSLRPRRGGENENPGLFMTWMFDFENLKKNKIKRLLSYSKLIVNSRIQVKV